MAFTATISGVTHTYVFIQGNAGGTDNSSDVLIDVLNVSATSLVASGDQLSLLDNVAPNAPRVTSVTDNVSPVLSTVADGGSTNDTTPTIRVSLSGTNAISGDKVQLFDDTSALGSSVTLTGTDITNGFVDITPSALTNRHDLQP